MNVARPSSSATSASQVARSRLVSSRGSPVPPDSDRVSGVVMFRRPGSVPPQTSAVPAKRRRGQQPVVVAGQHRHRPGPGAADGDDHPAGPAGHVGAADGAQVGADQPGAGAQADQPGRPHPPRRGGLGVGQGEIPGDLRRAVGLLGPLPRQRHIRRDTAAAPPGGR